MRISDWHSDVYDSDLLTPTTRPIGEDGSPCTSGTAAMKAIVGLPPGPTNRSEAARALLRAPSMKAFTPPAICGKPGLATTTERKIVVSGKSVQVRVHLDGRRLINKKNTINQTK